MSRRATAWALGTLSAWALTCATRPWLPFEEDTWAARVFWASASVLTWIVPGLVALRRDGVRLLEAIGLRGRPRRAHVAVALAWLVVPLASAAILGAPPAIPLDAGSLWLVTLTPLVNEVAFRGVGMRLLLHPRATRADLGRAVAVTATVFGLVHAMSGIAQARSGGLLAMETAGLVLFGLFLGHARGHGGTVLLPLALHALHAAWITGLVPGLLG